MSPRVAKRVVDGSDGALGRLGHRFRELEPGRLEGLAELHRDLDTLQAVLEGADRPGLADSLARVALLAEVWECLVAESPGSAREVAEFCAMSIDEMAAISAEDEAAGALAWILEESADRWGGYLGLLDEGLSDQASTSPFSERPEEEPPPSEDG